jgi:transposase
MGKGSAVRRVIGIDQGDRWSHLCVVDARGEKIGRERVRTTRKAYEKRFGGVRVRTRVVLEVGPHSPWASRLLEGLGYEVVVANARRVKLIAKADRKTDRVDAETLARLGRIDPVLLAPIRHGGEAAQRDTALLRVREGLVRSRTRLIQQARGLAKALGERLPASSAAAFPRRVREVGQGALLPGLDVLLEMVELLTERIRRLDREVERAGQERHSVTTRLRQVPGVGPITALAYVLKVEDPTRFAKSREVGPFVALVPRERSSGEQQPELGIPPRGDAMLRRLLVQCAHYILGPFGPDTELRRFGLRMAARGGKRAKKRAVVAVARKLAVLLHRLWVTGEPYQPLGYGKAEPLAA